MSLDWLHLFLPLEDLYQDHNGRSHHPLHRFHHVTLSFLQEPPLSPLLVASHHQVILSSLL